ncbi:hypothetical protein EV363DRAFT_1301192 [Boletus edulis]|nr:hypothetical protein EV363DRAFT_1301192 [Boletus edulis]
MPALFNPLDALVDTAIRLDISLPPITSPSVTLTVIPSAGTSGPSKAAAVAIKTVGKKIVKMHPGPTPNGRNLCAHRWLKVFKDSTKGTTAEFKVYYDGLSNEQKAAYDKEAKELASGNAWNKDTYDGTIY